MASFLLMCVLVMLKDASAQERFPITIDPAATVHEVLDAAKTLAMIAVNSIQGSIDGYQQLAQDLLDAFVFGSSEAKIRSFREAPPSASSGVSMTDDLAASREFITCVEKKGREVHVVIEDAVKGIGSCLRDIVYNGKELASGGSDLTNSLEEVSRLGIREISKCVSERTENLTDTARCFILALADVARETARTSGPRLLDSAGRARYLLPSVAVCIALKVRIARDRVEHLAIQVPLCMRDAGTTSEVHVVLTSTVPETSSPSAVPETSPNTITETSPSTVPETSPNTITETSPNTVPETSPNTITETSPSNNNTE